MHGTESLLLMAFGSLAMIVGFVGCFLPVLPGPAIAYAALWALALFGHPPSMTCLVLGGIVLIFVTAVDYVLPSVFAKRFRCSRWGVFGCFAGSIVGLFFMPLGLVLGPFLGTVAGELLAGKDVSSSLRGGLGALLGFVLCVGLKVVSVGLYAWWYFVTLH